MKHPVRRFAALLAAFVCACAAAADGVKRPITFADLPGIKEPTVTLLGWSADSASLFLGHQAAGAAATEIVQVKVADGSKRSLGTYAGTGFSLSPAADQLVHFEAGDWKVEDLRTGQSHVLFKSPGFQFLPVPPAWSRDGRYVAVLEMVQPEGLARLDPNTVQESGGVRVIDVGAAADGLVRQISASAITVIDTRSGATVRKLQDFVRILDAGWGEGDRLYYSTNEDRNLSERHVWITEMSVSTGKTREIFREEAMIQPLRTAVSPDGKQVAVSYNFKHPVEDNFQNLVLVDLATLDRRRLSGPHRVTRTYLWMPDGKSIVYAERRRGLVQLSRVWLDGKTAALNDDERNNTDLRMAPDGRRIAYIARDGYGGQQVMVRALAEPQARVALDVVDYRKDFVLGSFESVRWTSRDGLALDGYLFRPPAFDAAKKYPVIVDIHGGGSGATLMLMGPIWMGHLRSPLEWHAWAAMGYVVFVPEMRSSGDYGEEASRLDINSAAYGMDEDIPDIVGATDWILGRPWIDARRAALYGMSAGGGRVNKVLTVEHRYAAGVIQDPIRSGALETLITQALPPYTGVKIGKQPCLDALAAGDTSLCGAGFLFDGRNSTTPTLIFVGNQEMGAVLGFSMDVLFTTLRKKNVPARMLRYMAEGHGSSSFASAAHKSEEMRKWLETWLR